MSSDSKTRTKGGRPRKYGDLKPARIGIIVHPDLKNKLQLLARLNNKTLSDQMSEMLEAQVCSEIKKSKVKIINEMESK